MGRVIGRDPRGASSTGYDLIIVGGGVYGSALALESARRGLTPLLVERADFGQHTTWNSLRIVHGGLRYLQTLDLRRFFESVEERRWFLRHFPAFVRPLPCMMPLYGEGLQRGSVLWLALWLNDRLSRRRNEGVRSDRELPAGQLLSVRETIERFPMVDREGLRGAALWYDAVMPDSQRLLIEMLRWARESGAVLLNYMEAERILTHAGKVSGLVCRDRVTGEQVEFRGRRLVNAAGPWSRCVARALDHDVPGLFRTSLAFNLLLDRAPSFDLAVAVRPRNPTGRVYFLHPFKGRILAGTYHAPWSRGPDGPGPDARLVERFLDDLRRAIPGFELRQRDVLRVHWGLLPAAVEGTDRISVREVVHDHASTGGPKNLWSISGVKFTTARRVAERTLRHVLGHLPPPCCGPPPEPELLPSREELLALSEADPGAAAELVRRLMRDEAALQLADLLLRRTDWGMRPDSLDPLAGRICDLLGWDPARRRQELCTLGSPTHPP